MGCQKMGRLLTTARLQRQSLCWLVVAVALAPPLRAQIGLQSLPRFSAVPATKEKKSTSDKREANPAPQKSLGWGSNIQNARLARAAEMALKDGKYAAALDFAQRAAQGAPNDPQLWFLLGYCARLAGKTQLSIDSYNQGLRLNPNSLDGKSGLAQAYGRAGRVDEAKHILTQVLAADPKRTSDLVILGELLMQAGKYQEALSRPATRREGTTCGPAGTSDRHLLPAPEPARPALHYLELAQQRAPNDPEVQRSLAGYYRETGNYPAAIAALKPIAGRSPP